MTGLDHQSETPPDDRDGDGDDSHPSHDAKRRRTGGTSRGRGVANLTKEQLERKRANDREAQRAIRERTKNTIEGLKARIRELESSQPYNELQMVVRERDAARAEVADIKRRLEAMQTLIQPVLQPSSGLDDLATAAEQNSLPIARPPPDTPALPSQRPNETRILHHQPSIASPQHGVPSPAVTDPKLQWMVPGDAPTSHVREWSAESHSFEHSQAPPHHVRPEMSFNERVGHDILHLNGQATVDPNLPPPLPRESDGPGPLAPQLSPYRTQPQTVGPTCQLDVIMLDFLRECQNRARHGVPLSVLAGPYYPNFTALVQPDRVSDSHLLSKLFTDIIQTFPDICRLPEQVAVVYIMFLIMRWQIEPTQQNYDRLPEWVTPRATQLFIPHPYWINHLPWPRLRDRLITNQPFTSFNEFFVPFTTTLSLNWPYNSRDVLVRASSTPMSAPSPYSTTGRPPSQATASTPGGALKDEDQWVINPVFEEHLKDLANWSLGPSFAVTFPHLADTVKIRDGLGRPL